MAEKPPLKKPRYYLKKRDLVVHTCRDLLEDGLPPLIFKSEASIGTSDIHFYNHLPIGCNEQHPSPMLDDIQGILREADNVDIMSWVLHALERKQKTISYDTASEIADFVQHLLHDVVNMCGFSSFLSRKPEVSLSKTWYLGRGSKKADFWVVMTATKRPIMIIKVKCPHTEGVLGDVRVLGETWDYMMDTMSFFGQTHIFGITTFENFQFHWFPHSDAYATAPTATPESAGGVALPNMVTMADARALRSSRIVHHTDPDLVPLFISALVKSVNSPHAPVGMVDSHRAYLRASASGWDWHHIAQTDVNRITFNVTDAASQAVSFIVLKYFLRTAEKKVWLAVAGPAQQIVVVKLFADNEEGQNEANAERDLWERVNGVSVAFCAKLKSSYAMCAPMAIHASEDGDTDAVYFDFDISHWGSQRGAETQPLPPALAAFSARVQQLGAQLDVRDVARRAIARAARAGVVHQDLEWRHIALLPVFDAHGEVAELTPVLLDFGIVRQNVPAEAARRRCTSHSLRWKMGGPGKVHG